MIIPLSGSATPGKQVVSHGAMKAMLGIDQEVPMAPEAMARSLRVTFLPGGKVTPRVERFTHELRDAMIACGVDVIPYDLARNPSGGRKAKLKEGIVVIAPGELETGNLPVDHVTNLRSCTAVGIIDGPCPADPQTNDQQKLNAIVGHLAWSIVQVAIFVEDGRWTICTMNGAIIPCPHPDRFRSDVFQTLIPKLAAPVVPPHASDFQFEEGALDLRSPGLAPYVTDFVRGAPLWAQTGLMLFHTSLASLTFRSPYYRRIAAAYLDRRSGMSYGFLARQLAVEPGQILSREEADREPSCAGWQEHGFLRLPQGLFVRVHLHGDEMLVRVPRVRVLSTRSGCDKAHIDGYRDLMMLELVDGTTIVSTPAVRDHSIDYRPSYDTATILAHALGNALVADIETHIGRAGTFTRTLRASGYALAHWHGTLASEMLPDDLVSFGDDNPPVSCSTHQAALFALAGKLHAFSGRAARGLPYGGDVHVEPHHGVNVSWPTLEGLAHRLLHKDGAAREQSPATAAGVPARR